MIAWLAQEILYLALFVLAILGVLLNIWHFLNKRKINFYRAQGVHALDGWDTFLIGHVSKLLTFQSDQEKQRSKTNGNPMKPPLSWLFDQSTDSKAPNSFDYSRHEVSVLNLMEPYLLVSDPAIVQEMMTSKNGLVDKTGIYEMIFKNFFGRFFLYTKSDERWKNQRKGLLSAFYKDKLVLMVEQLKD